MPGTAGVQRAAIPVASSRRIPKMGLVLRIFFSLLLHLLAVFSGRHLHQLDEVAVEAGYGMEAYHLGDVQNRVFCTAQQDTGFQDPGIVHIVQRGGAHDIVEDPAEVRRTPMAQFRQIFNGKLLHIIFFDIIQSG